MRIDVRVIPNAARTGITGTRGNEIVLRVNAPATEGKANKAVVLYLARTFGVARSAVHLLAGEKSRHKKFEIVGLKAVHAQRKIASLLETNP